MGRKMQVEKLVSNGEKENNATNMEEMNETTVNNSNGLSPIILSAEARRSERLKRKLEPIWVHVNLVGPKRKKVAKSRQIHTLPTPTETNVKQKASRMNNDDPVVDGRTLEEKVDYIVEAVDEFTSKDNGSSNGVNYKNLFVDSQKKIEEMMEDNLKLVSELSFARGKIEAYEKMSEVLFATTLERKSYRRATEAATLSLSPRRAPPTDAEDLKVSSPKGKKKNNLKKSVDATTNVKKASDVKPTRKYTRKKNGKSVSFKQ